MAKWSSQASKTSQISSFPWALDSILSLLSYFRPCSSLCSSVLSILNVIASFGWPLSRISYLKVILEMEKNGNLEMTDVNVRDMGSVFWFIYCSKLTVHGYTVSCVVLFAFSIVFPCRLNKPVTHRRPAALWQFKHAHRCLNTSLNGVINSVFGPTTFKTKRVCLRCCDCNYVWCCYFMWPPGAWAHLPEVRCVLRAADLTCVWTCETDPAFLRTCIRKARKALCRGSVSRPLSAASIGWRASSAAVYFKMLSSGIRDLPQPHDDPSNQLNTLATA